MQHERPGDNDLVTTDDLSSGVPGIDANAAQGSNIPDGRTSSSGQENQNWITALIALKFAKEGLEHVTLTLIENLHKQIKIKLETNVRQCNGCKVNFTNKKPVVKCPANDCNMWVNEILKYTAVNHDLNWDIVSLEEIKKKPWKLAALFQPAHCYAFQGPQETDITSLLTLLSKCTFFNGYVPVEQVEELRKIAENLIVSSSMKIGDRNELIKEIDCIIGVLQHHDMYKYDEKCQQAVQKTDQLRDAEYEPGPSDEHCVISELITWMKQKIQSLRREMARAKDNYDKCRSDYLAKTLANQVRDEQKVNVKKKRRAKLVDEIEILRDEMVALLRDISITRDDIYKWPKMEEMNKKIRAITKEYIKLKVTVDRLHTECLGYDDEMVEQALSNVKTLNQERTNLRITLLELQRDFKTAMERLQYSTPEHGTSKDEAGALDQKLELEKLHKEFKIETNNTKEKYEAIRSEGEKVENTIQMLMDYMVFRGTDQWSNVHVDLCRVRKESKDLSKKVMKYILMVEHDVDEWQQPDRFSDKGYLNWVNACLVLRHGKEGMEDLIVEVITQLHETIKSNIEKSSVNENDAWIQSLQQHSAKKKKFSKMHSGDIQCLKETPWKIVDVYLGSYHEEKKDPNRPKVPTKPKEPQELDISAFVNLMLECSDFRVYATNKTVDKVRTIRNEIFHSPRMRIDEDSVFERYTKGVLDLLNEIKNNSNTKITQSAVEKIERIRDNQDVPRAVHETEIFKSHVESMEQELQSKKAKLETVTEDEYNHIKKEIEQIETTCQRYASFIDFQMIDQPQIRQSLDDVKTQSKQIIIDAECKFVIEKTKQECDKDLIATKSQLEKRIRELLSENNELKQRNEKLMAEKDELEQKNKELKLDKENLEKRIQELLSENYELRQKKRELTVTISNYELDNYHRKRDGHCWACHKYKHCPCKP